jgi:CMP-N-acetylneuraminic acid synthetase
MKTLGIIPARGGSKGIPGKNIKLLFGKPLIEWTIQTALNTPEITTLIVSTDDINIAEIAQNAGASVPFVRPGNLASDTATSIDVVIHAIEYLQNNNEHFDNIVLLEPTSPLRKKNDISNALKLFFSEYVNSDGIISLGEIHLENPIIGKKVNNNFIESFNKFSFNVHQRQQYPKAFFPYGVLYCIKTCVLLNKKTFYTEKIIPYYIERWQNYEIDDYIDFEIVKLLMKKFYKYL